MSAHDRTRRAHLSDLQDKRHFSLFHSSSDKDKESQYKKNLQNAHDTIQSHFDISHHSHLSFAVEQKKLILISNQNQLINQTR